MDTHCEYPFFIMGFKTVVINEECKISLDQNNLLISLETEKIKVFIKDINCAIFMHDKVIITIPIITRLIEENVAIIICNKKNDPIGSFLPFSGSSLPFKQLKSQINWKVTKKKKLWKLIIENKIQTEIDAIRMCNKSQNIDKLLDLKSRVKSGDPTNTEGLAAKYYFKSIFGNEFFRNNACTMNYALNYGYKIIAGHISRQITARGYLTQLGIKHCSESNDFNLTYDFIETFRVIVDIWVYENVEEDSYLTICDKMSLVNILNTKIEIEGKKYYLTHGINKIIDSYFGYLSGDNDSILSYNLEKIMYED